MNAREITLVTEWGNETFYVCRECSAVIDDPELHEEKMHPKPEPVESLNGA
jgi:hypothetical protein